MPLFEFDPAQYNPPWHDESKPDFEKFSDDQKKLLDNGYFFYMADNLDAVSDVLGTTVSNPEEYLAHVAAVAAQDDHNQRVLDALPDLRGPGRPKLSDAERAKRDAQRDAEAQVKSQLKAQKAERKQAVTEAKAELKALRQKKKTMVAHIDLEIADAKQNLARLENLI